MKFKEFEQRKLSRTKDMQQRINEFEAEGEEEPEQPPVPQQINFQRTPTFYPNTEQKAVNQLTVDSPGLGTEPSQIIMQPGMLDQPNLAEESLKQEVQVLNTTIKHLYEILKEKTSKILEQENLIKAQTGNIHSLNEANSKLAAHIDYLQKQLDSYINEEPQSSIPHEFPTDRSSSVHEPVGDAPPSEEPGSGDIIQSDDNQQDVEFDALQPEESVKCMEESEVSQHEVNSQPVSELEHMDTEKEMELLSVQELEAPQQTKMKEVDAEFMDLFS